MKKLIYEKYTVKEKRTVPQPHGPDYVYYVDVVKRRNPQLREVVAIYSHGKSCVAHYRHGKKVWPEDENLKNSIIVELPEEGSLDWAYWVHALARVEERGYSKDNYVRIKIDGKYYYVGAAPAGQKALQVRGGQFYYSDGRAVPQIAVGDTLTVEANVRENNGYVSGNIGTTEPLALNAYQDVFDKKFATQAEAKEEGFSWWNDATYYQAYLKGYTITELPLLPHDTIHLRVEKWKKHPKGYAEAVLYSMPSNTEVARMKCNVTWTGTDPAYLNKNYTDATTTSGRILWQPKTGGQIINGDTYWRVKLMYCFNGGSDQCSMFYRRDTKAFTRTWQMPVILTT